MNLTGISFQSFRKLSSATFLFDQPITVLVGANGSGKTTILEGVAMLATGKSFRAGKIEELITFEAEHGRVKGVVAAPGDDALTTGEERTELELLLTRGMVQGKKTRSVLYSVNDVRKQRKTFVGKLLTVLFRPEDMRLIEGSPSRRRSFLDEPLSMLDGKYSYALKTYNQALVRRNKILTQIREGEMPRTVLTYWNQQLVKYGTYLQDCRQKFIEFCATVEFPLEFTAVYQPSIMSEARLAEYAGREVAAGHTLVGPHKDDFEVTLPMGAKQSAQSLGTYGSRGQQRMGVLWLKLCEFVYVEHMASRRPLLLLDDIFSELDDTNRDIIEQVMQDGQTILTSADADSISHLAGKTIQLSS